LAVAHGAELDIDLDEDSPAGSRLRAEREEKDGRSRRPPLGWPESCRRLIGMVWYVLRGKVEGLKDPVADGMIGTLIGYVSAKARSGRVRTTFGDSAGSARERTVAATAGECEGLRGQHARAVFTRQIQPGRPSQLDLLLPARDANPKR
jgi:hypothetical protein